VIQHITFSAVIPTYNRAHLVPRAIQSALDQSLPPHELIVVDDGSTDETEEILTRLFGGRIRYVRQENGGGARARNRGVQEASREWVAFLDSDDVWTAGHLENIAHAIEATHGGAVLYFDDMALPAPAGGTWWGEGGFAIPAGHVVVPDGSDWVLREYQPTMLQTSVCSRNAFLEEGGLWEDLHNAHDTHFFLKLGIGRPLCAIQGIGCRQMADAPSRLTSIALEKRRYLNKTLAFRDILRTKPHLTTAQRRCLRHRIASSFWMLGRIAWEEHRLAEFAANVMRSAIVDLPTTGRLAAHAVRGKEKASHAASVRSGIPSGTP
jgi:hypothetical protein